jgi:hypothetical protein
MHKRNGKIARLPKDLRELVNRMLDDGAQYRSIINELDKHRHRWPDDIKEFTDGNFTEWHQGGYQDWVREQEIRADLQARREYAEALDPATSNSDVADMVTKIGALRLYHLLASIERGQLESTAVQDPATYTRLVNAFARLSRGSTDRNNYRDHVARWKHRLAEQLARAKNGAVTAETIIALESELKLL